MCRRWRHISPGCSKRSSGAIRRPSEVARRGDLVRGQAAPARRMARGLHPGRRPRKRAAGPGYDARRPVAAAGLGGNDRSCRVCRYTSSIWTAAPTGSARSPAICTGSACRSSAFPAVDARPAAARGQGGSEPAHESGIEGLYAEPWRGPAPLPGVGQQRGDDPRRRCGAGVRPAGGVRPDRLVARRDRADKAGTAEQQQEPPGPPLRANAERTGAAAGRALECRFRRLSHRPGSGRHLPRGGFGMRPCRPTACCSIPASRKRRGASGRCRSIRR